MREYINRLRRMKPFQRFILLLIPLFILMALIDIKFDDTFRASTVFWEYVSLYWMWATAFAIGIGIVYYNITKDKSEAVAFPIAFYVLHMTGLEDVLYYLIKIHSIPSSMDHLFTHPVMGNIAKVLGYNTVTPTSLIISVLIGITITYYIVKYLRRM